MRTSDNATSDIQERAKQMLTDYIMGMIMANMGPEEAMRF
nr:MAG TPA: hypothetical protein [Crassvirales sp.]